MSTLSQFSGVKPLRTVVYTSGTGTFTPLVSNSWCRVTMLGGGGGGAGRATVDYASAGAASGCAVVWWRCPGAVTYAVGAAGTGGANTGAQGTAGGTTSLGTLFQPGGSPGVFSATSPTNGGAASASFGMGAASTAGGNSTNPVGGSSPYGAGGALGAAGTGNGAGGGGAGTSNNTAGGNGSGGLLMIEEFGA